MEEFPVDNLKELEKKWRSSTKIEEINRIRSATEIILDKSDNERNHKFGTFKTNLLTNFEFIFCAISQGKNIKVKRKIEK